jgi:AcrR family transcriptional regulator
MHPRMGSAKRPDTAEAPRTGRREANKRDKLARIRRAARDVFLRKGYEDATLREIAAAADVAFGTLFLYAKNKQDLLLLLFDEELPELTERAFQQAKPDMPFVDQLIAFFAEFYAFFNETPALSRDMMREITFTGGIVSARIWEGVQGTEERLARLVARAQADDRVSSSIAPGLAAHVIFSLYRVEIRFCLDEAEPDVAGSLAKLRQQFEVVFTGLAQRRVNGAGEAA